MINKLLLTISLICILCASEETKKESVRRLQPNPEVLMDPSVGLDQNLLNIQEPIQLYNTACLDHQMRINELIKFIYLVPAEQLEELRQKPYDVFFSHGINIITIGMRKKEQTDE